MKKRNFIVVGMAVIFCSFFSTSFAKDGEKKQTCENILITAKSFAELNTFLWVNDCKITTPKRKRKVKYLLPEDYTEKILESANTDTTNY